MLNVKLSPFLAGVALVIGLGLSCATSFAHEKEVHATGKSGRVPMPVLTVNTAKGDQCVEPREVMLRDHMKLILHQRDKTVHDGIRTPKHSLKNCVDCHADSKTDSVLGKEGFCASCHVYASVKIDCFECHSSTREKVAANNNAVSPPSSVRALNTAPKGKKP